MRSSRVGRIFKDTKITRIHIDDHFDEKEADAIRKGLKTTTTMTQLDFTNYVPLRIVQAISEGLKQNKSIQRISYREYVDEQPGDTLPQDSLRFLREIFAIRRIRYQICLKDNSSVLEIINGESAQYIKHPSVTVGSAQLDELLYGLRDNEGLAMDVVLKQDNSECKNLSLFGNLRLANLKIQIRSDELDQLFTALKNVGSLCILDLSNSIITTDGARHLADLIVQLPNLSYLNLSSCQIGNKQFSIICRGILKNSITAHINVQDNPFDRLKLDLVDQTLTERKKMVVLETDTFDINMAKIFDITKLNLRGHNFDGLRAAKILHFSVTKNLTAVQQATNLFNELMYNRQIYSLRITGYDSDDILCEICKQLAVNKTLKSVAITHKRFGEKSFKLLCEFIEKNNTLETLIHDATFTILKEDDSQLPLGPFFEALKKNTSLTKIDFYRLHCEDWDVEELLKANPYLTFTELRDRPRGSRASKLNAKNMRNINRRLADIKCNVVTLARSHLVNIVPFEVWQMILDQVRVSNEDWLELFKQSLRKK